MKFIKSIRFRLLFIWSIAVITFFIIVSLFFLKKTEYILQIQTDEYGQALSSGIASALKDAIIKPDKINIKESLQTIGRAYKRIASIKVYVKNVLVGEYERNNVDVSDISKKYSSPVLLETYGKLGQVDVRYYKDIYFNAFLNNIKILLYFFAIFFFILLFFLFFTMEFLVLRPLNKLRRAVKYIAGGVFGYELNIRTTSEFNELTDIFNSMSNRLKESRDALVEWNNTLEQKVDARTKEIEELNVRLQEVQYRLMESGKLAAVGMVGYEIAHELNNPLSFILGYTQIMLMRARKNNLDFKYVTENLEIMEHEIKRCSAIVKSIAGFARSGRKEYAMVDLQKVIYNTVNIMKYQLKKWKISLKLEIKRGSYSFKGNADKLQQIFINLIVNAHNAMPKGGNITIYLSKNVNNTDMILIIEDDGPGIEKDIVNQLFAKFFSTYKEKDNMGLGLSIVQQIVREHEGTIAVESKVGVGTKFIIKFPLMPIMYNSA